MTVKQWTPETAKRAAEKMEAYPNPCEYNPEKKRAAFWDEVHGSAEWIIGADGQWRLCNECARLPYFKRFRTRSRMKKK